MRIIHILHGNIMIGGMEKFSIDLCNEFSISHDVMFISDICFKGYVSDNVKYVPLDITKSRNNPFFLYHLYKLIKDFSPDIIHVHKQKSIEIIKRLAWVLDIPFVATKHDIKAKKAFYNLEYAISISDMVTPTIKAKKVYKIYNGIPFVPPKKIELSPSFNIVAIGGLKVVKGYENLIKTVATLAFPYHLTIVGEGVLREPLTKLIRDLNIEDKISLVGLQSNISDYIYSADLQIVSSSHEGFSLALAEGVIYGSRLLSTNVGIAPEILEDELIYKIENLAEKIFDVYENKEHYENLFYNVKNKYKQLLTIEKCAVEHVDIYHKIIEDYHA